MPRTIACAWLLLVCNGAVAATTLEQLVMPGPLTAAHADLEADCGKCHTPFARAAQDALCRACHEEVDDELRARSGFHGRLSEQACSTCHTEHKGRDADIVGLRPELFDHRATDFPLTGAHTRVACGSCHQGDTAFRSAAHECVSCHRAADPHRGRLGDECGTCHDESAWRAVAFDHGKTRFPLSGAHRDVECRLCHVDQQYESTDRTCHSCHALDDVHRGTRGTDCASCHETKTWKTQRFDHAQTGFALLGSHATLTCDGCHGRDMAKPKPPKSCFGCHSIDDAHAGRNGTACGDCHGNTAWERVHFDHRAASGFALRAAHAALDCAQCHVGKLEDPLETTCEGCHADDDPHEGTLPQCSSCHDASSWHRAAFEHDLTTFPLVGQHRGVSCETCHSSSVFAHTKSACRECHAEDDYHGGALGDDCGRCHNPNGWDRWLFDHDAQTRFPLLGSHAGLACAACHQPDAARLDASITCATCHRRDDAHRGAFGPDCGRCHVPDSFSDLSHFESARGMR